MVCSGEIRFYTGHGIKVSHELRRELGTSVADGFSWETEFCPDVIAIDAGSAEGGEFHVCWESNDIFGESINDYNNCVVSGRFGEWSNKVDGYMFPRCIRDCVRV